MPRLSPRSRKHAACTLALLLGAGHAFSQRAAAVPLIVDSRAVVELEAGTYQYDSVIIEPLGQLRLLGDVTLNVAGNVEVRAEVNAEALASGSIVNGRSSSAARGTNGTAGADGTDGSALGAGSGTPGQSGAAGADGDPEPQRGLDLTINSGGRVRVEGVIDISPNHLDGEGGGSGGSGGDGGDGFTATDADPGAGGNAGGGGSGGDGGDGSAAGSTGRLVINAVQEILLPRIDTGGLFDHVQAVLDTDGRVGGFGGAGGPGGSGGEGGDGYLFGGGNGGAGGIGGDGGDGDAGGDAGDIFLHAPSIVLEGTVRAAGGDGAGGGAGAGGGRGGSGGDSGLNATGSFAGLGGHGGGGGNGGNGGDGGDGGDGGNLTLRGHSLTNAATAEVEGGGGGNGGGGGSGGSGGSGGAGTGGLDRDGSDGAPGLDGADGEDGDDGTVALQSLSTLSASAANGSFDDGTALFLQQGSGTASIVDEGGDPSLLLSTDTGIFSLSQFVGAAVTDPLSLGIDFDWLTGAGLLEILLADTLLASISPAANVVSGEHFDADPPIALGNGFTRLTGTVDPALLTGFAEPFTELRLRLHPGSLAQVQLDNLTLGTTAIQPPPAPVPEPPTLALLGLGCLALFAGRRTRLPAEVGRR